MIYMPVAATRSYACVSKAQKCPNKFKETEKPRVDNNALKNPKFVTLNSPISFRGIEGRKSGGTQCVGPEKVWWWE